MTATTRAEAVDTMEQNLRRAAAQPIDTTAARRLDAADEIYLMASSSFLGLSFSEVFSQRLARPGRTIFVVDDSLARQGPSHHGCPVLTSADFAAGRAAANAVAVNLSNALFAHGYFTRCAAAAGVTAIDIIPVLHYLDLPVIYQTAQVMRDATIARLEDYLALARRLDDVLSIQTLESCLAMRLTLDRDAVIPQLCSLEDEYFSPLPAGKDLTFALGQDEVLCDVGAHVGTTIHKFLAATRWNYRAIHAFEPDQRNHAALTRGIFASLPNFHPRNVALSDRKSVMRFSETGTMGSRIDDGGNVAVDACTLDDELDHITFLKMDVEGHETRILQGARRLLARCRPRMAITGYHYSDDLLDIAALLEDIVPGHRLRLRHHSYYYFDSIFYLDFPGQP